MKLKTIIDSLFYGPLNQVYVGKEWEDLSDNERKRLVGLVNTGLLNLYTRFDILRNEATVYLNVYCNKYTIKQDDLIKIEEILLPDGVRLENNTGEDCGFNSDSYNTFTLSQELLEKYTDTCAKVRYRATHPDITQPYSESGISLDEMVVELPQIFLTPLLLFVASCVFNPMGATNVEFHEGNNYAQKYEMACREIENKGVYLEKHEVQTKFQRNGWI